MKFISTKTHAILDYLMSIILITLPWMLGYYTESEIALVPIITGFSILLYSLFSNYELGVFHWISMKMHLNLDLFAGLVLTASPWLFGFSDIVFLPHFILGMILIIVSLLTEERVKIYHKRTGRISY